MDLRKWPIGEAVLWLAFAAVAVMSLDRGPENGVAIAGLLALAAIGVRATRPVVAAAVKADGE